MTKDSSQPQRRRGYTLMEMITVQAVLVALLATFLAGHAGLARKE